MSQKRAQQIKKVVDVIYSLAVSTAHSDIGAADQTQVKIRSANQYHRLARLFR